MLTVSAVDTAVYDVLRSVGAQRGIETDDLRPHLRLVDEIGFRSLDLARIMAMLELRLGVDPFAQLVPITSVRTVGDLCRAYRLAAGEGGDPGDGR